MLTRHFWNVGIGINFGMTLLGYVAAVLAPMPFVFYFTGKKIRRKSKFALAPDIEQDNRKRDEESNDADESNSSWRSGTRVWSSNGEAREKEEKGDRLVNRDSARP
jgi:DHA1 family multidrug resistance protein-like MFS transporter